MSVIHRPTENPLDARQLFLPGLIAVAFLAFLLRLWYLQVASADELQDSAARTGVAMVDRLAPRGLIVDREGRLLAGVRAEFVLTAKPRVVLRNQGSLAEVAAIAGIDAQRLEAEVRANLWRPYIAVPVYVGLRTQVAARIAEAGPDLEGWSVQTQPMRYYRDSESLAHVLGWVWTPSDRDVERLGRKGIEPAEYVGRDGLEMQYEEVLMGVPGAEKLRVDVRRRPMRLLGIDYPTPGQELVLSLDLDLQELAHRLLAGRRGAAVAIDPANGRVLCLASSPGYDVNLFRGGISQADFALLNEDPDRPLLRRAIAGTYPPGSTYKMVTALAAELAGRFQPSMRVDCDGFFQMGRTRFRCLRRHGVLDFRGALAKSCNTYFAELAVRAGRQSMIEAALVTGMNVRTGIDLPGEAAGVVPTEEWLDRNRIRWTGGQLVNMSMGQGYLRQTPLQMAQMTALIAARGRAFRPHLVRAFVDPITKEAQQVQPEESLRVDVRPEFWNTVHQAMREATLTGTAALLRVPGVDWAAKTGSSQHRRGRPPHSWMVAFAPVNNPRIAIAVVVEEGGRGTEAAGPITRDLLIEFFRPPPAPSEGLGLEVEVQAAQEQAAQEPAAEVPPANRRQSRGNEPALRRDSAASTPSPNPE